MKTKSYIYLFLLFIIFASFSNLSAQIPNGDLELWNTNSLGRLDLASWETPNGGYDAPTVIQDTGQSGTGYSARFTSVYDSSVGYNQAGYLNLDNKPFSGSVRPNFLLGSWKTYNPTSNDAIYAEVIMYDSAFTQIGYGGIQTPFTGSIPNWINFSVPISYTLNNTIAFYSIHIGWFNFGNTTASFGVVDNIRFDVSTDIDNDPEVEFPTVYLTTLPNANYTLTITKPVDRKFSVQVIDVTGRNIINEKYLDVINSESSVMIDLSSNASGIYFARLFDEKGFKVVRLMRP